MRAPALALIPAALATSSLAHAQAPGAGAAAPVPVEIQRGGDDGLTLRFAAALETAFRASPRFAVEPHGTSDPLRAIIPTHVGWESVGGRIQVSYRVELERGGRRLAAPEGRCWESELNRCAGQVVAAAASALRVVDVRHLDPGRTLSGEDFLLVEAASRHPRIRGANIGCFTILVGSEGPLHRVDFVAPGGLSERVTPAGQEIVWVPPDPHCRSISFLLNARREVVRVILSRH